MVTFEVATIASHQWWLVSFCHLKTMELKLFLPGQPPESAIHAMDKKLAGIAQSQEILDSGRRLWISRLPQTQMRPLLHAQPFDLMFKPLRLSNDEIEDYRVGIGAEPKHAIVCRNQADDKDTTMILFGLSLEIMTCTNALLSINPSLGQRMFHVPAFYGDDFPTHFLDDFPGSVYEVAHEGIDGILSIEWLVDAHWLRTWLSSTHRSFNKPDNPETARFASLDYT